MGVYHLLEMKRFVDGVGKEGVNPGHLLFYLWSIAGGYLAISAMDSVSVDENIPAAEGVICVFFFQ